MLISSIFKDIILTRAVKRRIECSLLAVTKFKFVCVKSMVEVYVYDDHNNNNNDTGADHTSLNISVTGN